MAMSIFEAIQYSANDIFREIIRSGIDLNNPDLVDEFGESPLHYACFFDTPEMASFLIENGANINCLDNSGQTPVHKACMRNRITTAQLLLLHGADIDCIDYEGRTPLHCACREGKIPSISFLIENGANVNRLDKSGRTALDSCLSNREEIRDLIELPTKGVYK